MYWKFQDELTRTDLEIIIIIIIVIIGSELMHLGAIHPRLGICFDENQDEAIIIQGPKKTILVYVSFGDG